jgi:transcriptional regulator with PAS, ATPase and Fis domain
MTKLALAIQDPGGTIRKISLEPRSHEPIWIGRDPLAPAPLKDPRLPARAGELTLSESCSEVWLKADPLAPAVELGSLQSREARLMEGVGVRWGDSELRLEGERCAIPPTPDFPKGCRPWLTQSTSGRTLLWNARKAARTPLSIFIQGETGTGKEVIASALHAWSDRAGGPFVPLNCAALSLSLVESELFGHVRGAFTGAHQHRPGALMQAHNGTLFLDEIGDLPMDIQVKLLRFLENGEIRAVGSDTTSRASVRVICATHKPLRELVESGQFRRDLYYRLASVTLVIPPLRARLEDIELLSQAFAQEFKKTLSPRAMLRLKSYEWPGNVRELRHTLERACSLAGEFSDLVTEEALDFLMDGGGIAGTDSKQGASFSPILNLQEMERHLLIKALRVTLGNRTEAAKLLGVARSTLFEMLKRHQINHPASGSALRGAGTY